MQSLGEHLFLLGFQARGQHGLVLLSLGCAGSGCSCKSFQAILGDLSGDATEQPYAVVKMVLKIPEVQFTILTKFGGKIRGGPFQFRSAALALGRARVVVVLFGLQRTIAGLGVRIVEVRLLFGLIRVLGVGFSWETSAQCSQ